MEELRSFTLDEYVDNANLEFPENPVSLVQTGGFIRAPSITPEMLNQQQPITEPGQLLNQVEGGLDTARDIQTGGNCGCASSVPSRNKDLMDDVIQFGGASDTMSIDTNNLFQQFLDENPSELLSMQSGGGNDSVDTNQLFNQFLADNKSELLSMQSGGGNDSVDTNQLFNQFLADNKSELLSVQSGGGSVNVNDSVDTNQLFNQFLADNKSELLSMQSGGGNDSVDTNQLFN